MNILIMGGTGFVGHALAKALRGAGHQVSVCSRRAEGKGLVLWDGKDPLTLRRLLHTMDAVINLQGENIGAARWTEERRRALRLSRQEAGHALSHALADLHTAGEGRPRVLLQASACGYYGLWREDAPRCTEDCPPGEGFLADTCVQWEAATAAVEDLGVRRCVLRLSPVLGKDKHGQPGGFIARMAQPYRYFVGGPAGSGRQPMSWIHLDDVCEVAAFLLDRPHLQGVFNCTAPHCPDMNEFARTLGRVLHRPALLRVPAFVLRLALGDMADELVLAGQHPVASRLGLAGYAWRWPTLETALQQVLTEENAH